MDAVDVFEVHCQLELGDEWESKDEEIMLAAGRKADVSTASCDSKDSSKYREHVWNVKTFEAAIEMRKRIELVQGVNVTIREAITYVPKHRRK